MNAPESLATLQAQQRRLLAGKRSVQMFPAGTKELPLPEGMYRIKNERGMFHYNPSKITGLEILALSAQGRENEFLELGPFSKVEIDRRLQAGETLEVISEYTPTGVEVRAAAGTNKTIPIQKQYFEKTKDPNNKIFCGPLPQRVHDRLKETNYGYL